MDANKVNEVLPSMESDGLNIEGLARPEIRGLKAYEGKRVHGVIKLDANENPFSWPAGMQEELFSVSNDLTRYPDGEARELKNALSGYTGIEATGILPGNGSDELIQVIMSAFGGPGRAVVIHPPTFVMYEAAAAVTGTKVCRIPLRKDLSLDVEGIIREGLKPETSMIIICNPNNPTGAIFPKEEILRIIRTTGKIVIVDEAYAEFSGESLIEEIRNHPNLLVLRTFSKAFGLAGLRLGYVLGQDEVIGFINRVRQPYNVNAFTQKAGVLALDLDYLKEYQVQIEAIKKETVRISEALREIPEVEVFPTDANFVLFKPQDAALWSEFLLSKGILVRNMGNLPVLGKCLRVSTGTPEENSKFVAAVKETSREVV